MKNLTFNFQYFKKRRPGPARILMLVVVFSLFDLQLSSTSLAQQPTLIKCPDSISPADWRNCTGSLVLPDGGRYQGEVQNGGASGQGVITQSAGRPYRYSGEVRNNVIEGYGTLVYRDGEKYVGDFIGGIFNGQGTLTQVDGSNYVGEFLEGKFHGRGTSIDRNGDRYVGEFRSGARYGQGTLTTAKGDRYNGGFRNGQFHGSGALTNKDGSSYKGDFRDGLPHGRGSQMLGDGTRYEGEFRSGLSNGQGVTVRSNGDRHEGEYRDGQSNGEGKLTLKNGETYSGVFRDGEFYGRGSYTFPNGERYEGEFRNNRFSGKGTYFFGDGSTYSGEFREGWLDGSGSYVAPSGEKYVGEYRKGVRDGKASLTFPSGMRYVGEFREGQPAGMGIEYDRSGAVVRQGEWDKGQLITSLPLDTSRYPFDQVGDRKSPSTVNSTSVDRSPTAQTTTSPVDPEALAAEQRRAAERAKAAELEKARQEALEKERQLAEKKRKDAEIKALLGKRLALVIGNASYGTSPLKNPVNDADDVSQMLKDSGFTVIDVRNAALGKMRQAVRQFGDMLLDNDVGLVYYSGHGVEVAGRNYLLPVNADIQREDEVADQSVDVSLVLEKMATANKAVNILILDACRDDPFGRGFRSRSKGLAVLDAPRGTIIAYATSPGRVADDGLGRNSPYTKNLLKFMPVPNRPIEAVFKDVRRGVQQDTKGSQTPWENTSLSGDFFLRVER